MSFGALRGRLLRQSGSGSGGRHHCYCPRHRGGINSNPVVVRSCRAAPVSRTHFWRPGDQRRIRWAHPRVCDPSLRRSADPTMPIVPVPHGGIYSATNPTLPAEERIKIADTAICRYTGVFNVPGQPSVSLPWQKAPLPIGSRSWAASVTTLGSSG